jgi:hypothetical protein
LSSTAIPGLWEIDLHASGVSTSPCLKRDGVREGVRNG